jgi:hypothetical protein
VEREKMQGVLSSGKSLQGNMVIAALLGFILVGLLIWVVTRKDK